MNAFKSGYGTVLYFEDNQVVEELQENFALYKDNFPIWSQQSSGMLQFAIWTALEIEGFGATLQHYNPLIDEEVRKEWEVQKAGNSLRKCRLVNQWYLQGKKNSNH